MDDTPSAEAEVAKPRALSPWSVRGVSRDARRSAAEAAARAGKTVGEWVTTAVMNAARAEQAGEASPRSPGAPAEDHIAALAARISETESRVAALVELARRLESNPGAQGSAAALSASSDDTVRALARPDLERTLSLIEEQLSQTDRRERSILAMLATVASRVNENKQQIESLEARLGTTPDPAPRETAGQETPGFETVNERIKGLVERLPPAEATAAPDVAPLADRADKSV